MKIAIIGGNRFVGAHLTKILLDKSHEVTLFNRSASGDKQAKIVKFDRDVDKIKLNKFDCIVDMCLYSSEQFELIKKSIPKSTRYIFVSSGAVKYKKTFGWYATEKENIEKELSKMKLNYVIVRPSYVVGNGNHIMRLAYFASRLNNGLDIEINGGVGDYPINLVWVEDVARCLSKIVMAEDELVENKTYNLCSDESITIDEIIKIMKEELNIKKHTIKDSLAAVFPKQPFEMDNKRTKTDIRFKFSDMRSVVKRFTKNWKNENKVS